MQRRRANIGWRDCSSARPVGAACKSKCQRQFKHLYNFSRNKGVDVVIRRRLQVRDSLRYGVESGAAWSAHGGRVLPDAHLLKGRRVLLEKVFFEDREIENERLELTDKDALYFLGSNADVYGTAPSS